MSWVQFKKSQMNCASYIRSNLPQGTSLRPQISNSGPVGQWVLVLSPTMRLLSEHWFYYIWKLPVWSLRRWEIKEVTISQCRKYFCLLKARVQYGNWEEKCRMTGSLWSSPGLKCTVLGVNWRPTGRAQRSPRPCELNCFTTPPPKIPWLISYEWVVFFFF